MDTFANRLRHYRKKAKFSQKRLAEKIGVGFATYNNYETKGYEPKIEILIKLANALGIDVNTLVGYQKNKQEAMLNILQSADIGYECVPEESGGILLDGITALDERETDADGNNIITISKDKGDSVNKAGSIRIPCFVSFNDLEDVINETQKEFTDTTSLIYKNIFSNCVYRLCVKNKKFLNIVKSDKDPHLYYVKLNDAPKSDLNNKG